MLEIKSLPPQALPFRKKGKKWRKQVVDWAVDQGTLAYSPVRKSVIHKQINYDLVNGELHMEDLQALINPDNLNAEFIPESIVHYPIMNSKLNVLKGEEAKRPFDYRAIVTNPNAISKIEEERKNQLFQSILLDIQNSVQSEEEFQAALEKENKYFSYEYQDFREVWGNEVINHYSLQNDYREMFNNGFVDAETVGEEIYQVDIVGDEPTITRLNPCNVRVYMSGYSNKIEDADVIVIEEYWSRGKIVDVYHEELTEKDIKYLENLPFDGEQTDGMGNIDERKGFVNVHMLTDVFPRVVDIENPESLFTSELMDESLMPYDLHGNVRVVRIYWKSLRKVKKVKSYDVNGEEVFTFYPETYVTKEELGEEEKIMWVNEAWEGTKIGDNIYVNMRPRLVQYNTMTNPSRCHFGIIGTIYNINESRPYSLVDMMKKYNYLYDVIHDRLNKLIARNWGILVNLDLAKKPTSWTTDKWLYFAKTMGLYVTNSFNVGNEGAAMGKLAGALNNASTGVINAELSNSIQQYINLLEFCKLEMSEVSGITKQREGQISNRETVGGVERATLQSSHITEWLFTKHESLKKRVFEALLETAKIAMKGKNMKFQYFLSDNARRVLDIDGNIFAECDYGIVVDGSNSIQDLNQKIEALAQAALQTQMVNFSTIMKLYTSASLTEKIRMVENAEKELLERQQQAQQAQQQAQQEALQAQQAQAEAQLQMQDAQNERDNETKILVATINANAKMASEGEEEEGPDVEGLDREKLMESMREFDEKLKLERDRLSLDREKMNTDASIRREQIRKQAKSSSSTKKK